MLMMLMLSVSKLAHSLLQGRNYRPLIQLHHYVKENDSQNKCLFLGSHLFMFHFQNLYLWIYFLGYSRDLRL